MLQDYPSVKSEERKIFKWIKKKNRKPACTFTGGKLDLLNNIITDKTHGTFKVILNRWVSIVWQKNKVSITRQFITTLNEVRMERNTQ